MRFFWKGCIVWLGQASSFVLFRAKSLEHQHTTRHSASTYPTRAAIRRSLHYQVPSQQLVSYCDESLELLSISGNGDGEHIQGMCIWGFPFLPACLDRIRSLTCPTGLSKEELIEEEIDVRYDFGPVPGYKKKIYKESPAKPTVPIQVTGIMAILPPEVRNMIYELVLTSD